MFQENDVCDEELIDRIAFGCVPLARTQKFKPIQMFSLLPLITLTLPTLVTLLTGTSINI